MIRNTCKEITLYITINYIITICHKSATYSQIFIFFKRYTTIVSVIDADFIRPNNVIAQIARSSAHLFVRLQIVSGVISQTVQIPASRITDNTVTEISRAIAIFSNK